MVSPVLRDEVHIWTVTEQVTHVVRAQYSSSEFSFSGSEVVVFDLGFDARGGDAARTRLIVVAKADEISGDVEVHWGVRVGTCSACTRTILDTFGAKATSEKRLKESYVNVEVVAACPGPTLAIASPVCAQCRNRRRRRIRSIHADVARRMAL